MCIPLPGCLPRCHIWVVNPARGGQREVNTAAADRVWQEAAEEARAEAEQPQVG